MYILRVCFTKKESQLFHLSFGTVILFLKCQRTKKSQLSMNISTFQMNSILHLPEHFFFILLFIPKPSLCFTVCVTPFRAQCGQHHIQHLTDSCVSHISPISDPHSTRERQKGRQKALKNNSISFITPQFKLLLLQLLISPLTIWETMPGCDPETNKAKLVCILQSWKSNASVLLAKFHESPS